MTNVILDRKPEAIDNEIELSVLPNEDEASSPVAVEQIACVRDANLRSLISRKKLHLVLDLDHTLLHAIQIRDLTPMDREYLRHESRRHWLKEGKLIKFNSFLIKPRPNVGAFLKEASSMFDLSIFTLGCKYYANIIVKILDPQGLYISPSNVFASEDCTRPMIKGLDVVNQDERVTLVVDDIKRVWVEHQKNVIEIKPYVFFELKSNNKLDKWLQLGGDESEQYGELARVLRELKKIYIAFFDMEVNHVDYESRDVRDVVEDVRKIEELPLVELIRQLSLAIKIRQNK